MKRKSFAALSAAGLALALIGVLAVSERPAEAGLIAFPPLDCSTVLCPAPDCPDGTKPVILPGDCCHTCVPTK